MKVDLRCVLIKDGALSMEMDGHMLTLRSLADNLDTPLQVDMQASIYTSKIMQRHTV